jgi:hypothetical protein
MNSQANNPFAGSGVFTVERRHSSVAQGRGRDVMDFVPIALLSLGLISLRVADVLVLTWHQDSPKR